MQPLVHFEIHTENVDRAIKFYSTVFGWEIKQWGDAEYWFIVTRRDGAIGINGGIVKRRGPAPLEASPVNAFVCTMDVPNIDEAIASVMANGGTIALEKMQMPGVGWLAYGKDPEGNIFGMNEQEKK